MPLQGRHSSCGSFACGSHWLRSGSGGNVSHGTPRMVRLLNTALIATHTMQIRFSHRPAREGGHDAKLPTVVVFSTPSREDGPHGPQPTSTRLLPGAALLLLRLGECAPHTHVRGSGSVPSEMHRRSKSISVTDLAPEQDTRASERFM